MTTTDRKVPTADQSAKILTEKIRGREPFFFIRYGDGAIECINGRRGMTCDLESYSPALGAALLSAWRSVVRGSNTFVGDWQSASFNAMSEGARYRKQYEELIGEAEPNFLHFESLLIMRESKALLDFYRAVAEDSRKKVYMGPTACAGAARMLRADHLITPMSDLFSQVQLFERLLLGSDFEILLYGAGMAGNIPAIRCWEEFPERTYVNLGSALDPLFMGRKSRQQQLSPERARTMFNDLL